jgi:hypothetical protein
MKAVFGFYYLYARYDINKAAGGAASDVVHGLLRRCLLSKCRLASRCTCRCIFIYADKESAAFISPIFVTLRNVQQHHVQNSCCEFHPSRKETLKMRTEMRLHPQVECGFYSADFCGTPNKETKYSKYFSV